MLDCSPLLSIIVPVYNGEEFIAECLDSVIDSSFLSNELEILVIDDNSSDRTCDIVKDYCTKYSFVFLIKKSANSGVSSTRNLGLQNAKGKYIAFIDSDDMFSKGSYQKIISYLIANNKNSFYFGYSHSLNEIEIFDANKTKKVKKEDSCKPSSCRYIFENKVIKEYKLQFDEEMRFNEDFLFNYCYIEVSGGIDAATNSKLYYYRPNTNSSTGSLKKDLTSLMKACQDSLLFCKKMDNFHDRYGIQKDVLYRKILSGNISNYLWLSMKTNNKTKSVLHEMEKYHLSLKDIKYKPYEGSSFKHKIKSLLEYLFRHKIVFALCNSFYKIVHRRSFE